MIEVKCGKCGKMFIPAPQHSLVDCGVYYCKPTCFINRDIKDKEKGKGRTHTARRVVMCDLNGNKVREFQSSLNAAEYFGYSQKCIQTACREKKPYRGYLWEYETE